MSEIIDATYPGPRGVPLNELPRGLVPPPPYVLEEIEWLKARSRSPWPRDYEVLEINYLTLFYYFENIPIVYRPTDKGPEVLAIGGEEVAEFVDKASQDELDTVEITVPG
jgi:hypothetical protein